MGLIFFGMAILAILGGIGVVIWARKTPEGLTCSMIGMATVLLFTGILMFAIGWVYR